MISPLSWGTLPKFGLWSWHSKRLSFLFDLILDITIQSTWGSSHLLHRGSNYWILLCLVSLIQFRYGANCVQWIISLIYSLKVHMPVRWYQLHFCLLLLILKFLAVGYVSSLVVLMLDLDNYLSFRYKLLLLLLFVCLLGFIL